MSERTIRRNAERSGYRLHVISGIYLLEDRKRVVIATRDRRALLDVLEAAA